MRNVEDLVCMAKLMPEEMIVAQLEKSLFDYKKNKSGGAKDNIMLYSALFQMKCSIEGSSVSGIINEIKELSQIKERLNNSKKGN